MMRSIFLAAIIAMIGQAPAEAKPDGNPNFRFECGFGAKRVSVTTEAGRLVYRFGTAAKVERTIVEDPARANILYRYTLYPIAASQQLRFRNGAFSYVVYNHFRAAGLSGEAPADISGLLVLKDDRIIARRKCRSGGFFDEDHRLDRLPVDPLELPIP